MNLFNLKNHNSHLSELKIAIAFFHSNGLSKFAFDDISADLNGYYEFFQLCMRLGSALARSSDMGTIARDFRCSSPKKLQNTMEWGMIMLRRVLEPFGKNFEKLKTGKLNDKLPDVKTELLRILKKIDDEFRLNGFHMADRYIPELKQAINLAA